MSFGSDLKQERERAGVALEAIASSTRVPHKYLDALERSAWAEMPGGIFTRGMVRSYCEVVGLDGQDGLGRLAASQPAAEGEPWLEFVENVQRSRAEPPRTLGTRWWGVLLMLLVLTVLSAAVWTLAVRPRLQPDAVPSLRTLLLPSHHKAG